MADEFDVIVLGLGPGGEAAVTQLAGAGLRVLGVDRRLVGGECPYYGCVPSKMVIRAAGALAEAHRVSELAGAAEVRADWEPVHRRIRDEATSAWDDTAAIERLEKAGATVVKGRGRLAGPGVVEVEGERYTAARGVLLNTGTEPSVPPVDGLADLPYWTNRDVFDLDTLPASLLVIGGGPIGVELAQAFARFGVAVTVVEMADRLVANEEPEASRLVEEALARDEVRVVTGAQVRSASYDDGRFTLDLGSEAVSADKLLVAAGRRNNLADLGLETVDLDPESRVLETDERMRVRDGLWAIGDITGKGPFTHMSMYQSGVACRDLLGQDGPWADYRAVSRVTFTDPEVGAVGMTEQQARDAGISVATGFSGDLGARGWIAEADGLVKVVADTDRGVLVGATAVGPGGGEILGLLVTAVHAEVPVATLRGMHFAYPTFHRAIQTALEDLD